MTNSNWETKHILKQQYPQRHFHYSIKDFFSFQTESGTISDWNESRNILVSENFIVGLIAGLEEEVGDASGVVMYNIGQQWGLEDAQFFRNWFMQEYGYEDFSQLNLMYVLEAWWWPFISQGWGLIQPDFDCYQQGFLIVEVTNSAFAQGNDSAEQPNCFIEAGLLGAFFSELSGTELHCVQIACESLGGPIK